MISFTYLNAAAGLTTVEVERERRYKAYQRKKTAATPLWNPDRYLSVPVYTDGIETSRRTVRVPFGMRLYDLGKKENLRTVFVRSSI